MEKVQDLFLDAYNETLARTPITFPVVTACFSAGQGSDGSRQIQDTDFLKKIAPPQPQIRLHQHLLRGILHPVLVLPPALVHLGSRLQQHLRGGFHQDRQPRRRHPEPPPAGRTSEGGFPAFLGLLRQSTGTASRINHAKRMFIKDRIERGSLPLYSLGFMDLSRQYSTCGFTGLHEALSILGFDMLTEEGLQAAEDALTVINETNAKLSKLLGTPHNMEQVPPNPPP